MKTTLLSTFVAVLMGASVQAQTPGALLGNVQGAAADIRQEVQANGLGLRSLVIDYFINGNPSPDVDAFVALTALRQGAIEPLEDLISLNVSQAAALDNYIDPANILSWAGQIEGLTDDIVLESQALRSLILAGNTSAANASALRIRADLGTQLSLARDIAREAERYIQSQNLYNVRIELVDQFGDTVSGPTGLMGFFALDQFKGEYVYPDYSYENREFIDLRGGTYTFGAYPGYFEGASSNTVTLKPALVGADGFIVVTLGYWSE